MGRRDDKKAWGGKYGNEGKTTFMLTGIVNDITENPDREVDYVYCFIEDAIKPGIINLFCVTVGWDLPMVEEGEKINIIGVMRTWATNGNGPKIELVAREVVKMDLEDEEKPVKKGRRG